MEKNVGGYDRVARLVVGLVLLIVGIAGYAGLLAFAFGPIPAALAAVLAFVVGLELTVTGLTQKCLINKALG